MTPKYRPGSQQQQNGGGGGGGMDYSLLDASALDLIRQLDGSLAETNQSIVESSREAESATHNARLAAEIRRRFTTTTAAAGAGHNKQKHPPHGDGGSSTNKQNGFLFSPTTMTAALDHQHQYQQQHHHHLLSPSPPAASSPHSRLAVAHAEELVDLSAQLEHVRSQLETEMLHHQECKAKLSYAESTTTKLHDHVTQLQDQMEAMQVRHDQVVAEKQEELVAAQALARQEGEDAEYAMEVAKQKIAEEQEMRTLLQQVLEKNEEYRRYIAEQQIHIISINNNNDGINNNGIIGNNKKAVSFRDPVDDLSQQNHRALVAMGRELLHRQLAQTSSLDDSTSTNSPSKQAAHALTTCQATAVILKESGHKLGCWEEKETSISDEVQLERLARNYTTNVELQMTQQRQSIRELESFCALLEQQQQ